MRLKLDKDSILNSYNVRLNSIMLIGLLPAVICMGLYIFLFNEYVIYSCTLLCALLIAFLKIKKSILGPNMVLINTFISLLICSIVKISTGNLLIPDVFFPLTLIVILFCISLIYISFPNIERCLQSFVFYKLSIINQVGAQIIVIFSMIYILVSCISFLFIHRLSDFYLQMIIHIFPPTIYILAIIANFFTIKSISNDYKKRPIIRVIGISDGEILITRRSLSCFQENKLDTPIEDIIFDSSNILDKAKRISHLSLGLNYFNIEPRFSIKYRSTTIINKEVILFVLPIENRKDIKLYKYRFVSPKNIRKELDRYSSYIKDEIDHLEIVAKVWSGEQPI